VKKRKLKAAAVPTPQSYDEANAWIVKIGARRRDLAMVETSLNQHLAAIKAEHEEKAAPLKAEVELLLAGVQGFCEAHRGELCKADAKFHRFPAGEVAWRRRPDRVTIRGKVASVIEWLERHGPEIFLRRKTEVNKEAMLELPAEAAKVPGVRIGSDGEDFSVEPFGAELSEVA
jgi:phage host-nuclease inhibitor protein Gam